MCKQDEGRYKYANVKKWSQEKKIELSGEVRFCEAR
jgi:hypothetical protein